MNQAFPWICAALIALTVGAVAGRETQPQAAPAPQQRAIPVGVCEPGTTGVWVDASTMECLKERP